MAKKENLIFKFNQPISYALDEEISGSTTIRHKSIYPAKFILNDHNFIESIEIPNDYYINIKIKGFEWIKIDLPSKSYLIKDTSCG